MDGRERLCDLLYPGLDDAARSRKCLGGSEAKVLHEAAYEIARIRAENAELTRQLEEARELLTEVAVSGVSMSDPRIDYVEVQIDTDTWAELREMADAAPEEG